MTAETVDAGDFCDRESPAGLLVSNRRERIQTGGGANRKEKREQGNERQYAVIHTNVHASAAVTPNINVPVTRLRPSEPSSPRLRPVAMSTTPRTPIARTMSARLAPSAMRMPMSRVRRLTAKAVTP